MWKRTILLLIIFQLFLLPLYAEKITISDNNPLRKMARGAVNAALCWVEVPRQTVIVNKEKGDIAGFFWGPLKGLTYTAGRFCVGVYEMATFLLPPYKPVVQPEFIFSEEEQED
ncbi:MAG: exosortase system-associated protein, TIGR04073 family [Candidatus Omnitrophica bacterium]|nr:exosortase system-associated protein, TIGR04073 family [Candidatus Omnitrophota bacterium]